jgi:uncharacterized protein (DUF1697 family)
MTVWVSLLRGINLGARNKVSMPVLREALTAAGLSEVRTHLQSGNVISQSRHRSAESVAALVRSVVAETFGIDVPVLARSPRQLREVWEWNPFPDAAEQRPKLVQVLHLFATPDPTRLAALLAEDVAPERLAARGQEIVVDYVDTVHGGTVQGTWLSRRLGDVEVTARNWNTLSALVRLTR